MAPRYSCLFLTLLFLLAGHARALAGRAERQAEADAFFAGPILRWSLRLSETAMAGLRDSPREYVPAELTVDGRTFQGIGVHLKGSAGSKRSVDDRPALTLNFDRFNKGQRVFGLEKIHLNNSVQDPTYINDNLASRVYRAAGIPATRATHALVELNGVDHGIYVVKEAYDENYLKRHFPDEIGRHGNLYDGGFIRDVDRNLEKDAGNGPDDFSDLKPLREATTSPLAVRRQLFDKALDVDRFLSFMAIQMTLDDWDGYVRNRNNYRVYVPRNGPAIFLPSGMDQLLRHSQAPIRDTYMGRVSTALMAMPRERLLFRDRMRSLGSNVLSETWLLRQMTEIMDRIDAAEAPNRKRAAAFVSDRSGNASRLRQRLQVVRRELASWPDPLPPWPVGKRLGLAEANWAPYVQTGKADCTVTNDPDGKVVYHIQARERVTRATIRSSVTLPGGSYRFSGRARCEGVDPVKDDLGIGVGVRLTGVTGTGHIEGTQPWSPLTHDFELSEDGPVELIIELRGHSGQAWFDLGSLAIESR
jgi:spore coat protein H